VGENALFVPKEKKKPMWVRTTVETHYQSAEGTTYDDTALLSTPSIWLGIVDILSD